MKGGTYREWSARCLDSECGWSGTIWEWNYNDLICSVCEGEAAHTEPERKGSAPSVVGDELNGYYAKHGVCNPDGSPRRFDSKTDLKRALNAAGLKIDGDTPGKPYKV